MASMPMLSAKHNVKLSWNFSATSHGKGPFDGVGATLKYKRRRKFKPGNVLLIMLANFLMQSKEATLR